MTARDDQSLFNLSHRAQQFHPDLLPSFVAFHILRDVDDSISLHEGADNAGSSIERHSHNPSTDFSKPGTDIFKVF